MFSMSLETLCPNSSPGYASWHPNQPFGIFTNKPLPVDNILPGDPRLLRPLRISLRAQFMGSGSQGLSASGVQPPEEMRASGTGFAQRSSGFVQPLMEKLSITTEMSPTSSKNIPGQPGWI